MITETITSANKHTLVEGEKLTLNLHGLGEGEVEVKLSSEGIFIHDRNMGDILIDDLFMAGNATLLRITESLTK